MDRLLAALRALAEPTRLRLTALAAGGEWTLSDLVEILGTSQPGLSRHIRLLAEAGVIERSREGPHLIVRLAASGPAAALARAALAHLPAGRSDPIERRPPPRLPASRAARARAASEAFRANPAAWDELRALGLPAESIEARLLAALPTGPLGRLLDLGTGSGRLLELLAPRAESATGVDLSRDMLAAARARLGAAGLGHVALRRADAARLPFPDRSFDLVTACMLLHHVDDPAAVIGEAGRVLAPGGLFALLDLAPHEDDALLRTLGHCWPGFAAPRLRGWLADAGLEADEPITVPGPLAVLLLVARRPASLLAQRDRADAHA
ncbi:MAG: metalloregulator ArsR/SmtB family transcription factor [Acetobacteraceae bacterium]|nr:metalloregulator ArsR/SmtB family transcription factor [Acetobacteraceae bacterium]